MNTHSVFPRTTTMNTILDELERRAEVRERRRRERRKRGEDGDEKRGEVTRDACLNRALESLDQL